MRISDWSSDVCSSDLFGQFGEHTGAVRSLLRRSRAADPPALDAMEDGGDQEEVEGGVGAVVGVGSPAGSGALDRHVIGLRRKVSGGERGDLPARADQRREMVRDGVVGEKRERVAARRPYT